MAIKRDDFPLPDVDDPLTAPLLRGRGARRARDPAVRHVRRVRLVSAGRVPARRQGGPLTWTPVSGRGTLFTWAVVRRAFLPAFADRVPFVTALVALDEDPAVRLCTYIVGTPAEDLVADAPVAVTFRPLEFTTVPGKSVVVPMFALA